jgi:hypothetical protein
MVDLPSRPSSDEFGRELMEILNEVRVALPGVQFLFAFLLTVPFSSHFHELSPVQLRVYFASFLCTLVSSALLIAPSTYHRLHWRRDVRDRERMLRTFTTLVLAASLFLASAMSCATYVITDYLFGDKVAAASTIGAAVLFISLWFGLPLSRRVHEPRLPGLPKDGH